MKASKIILRVCQTSLQWSTFNVISIHSFSRFLSTSTSSNIKVASKCICESVIKIEIMSSSQGYTLSVCISQVGRRRNRNINNLHSCLIPVLPVSKSLKCELVTESVLHASYVVTLSSDSIYKFGATSADWKSISHVESVDEIAIKTNSRYLQRTDLERHQP